MNTSIRSMIRRSNAQSQPRPTGGCFRQFGQAFLLFPEAVHRAALVFKPQSFHRDLLFQALAGQPQFG